MPKHKRGFIPNKYGVIQREVASSGGDSGGGDAVATRNILNGVLNCAWDKTSAVPKLLEIYADKQVKLNVDSDNPLVLAFANGWDDLDRPAQVVKRLGVAPSNIDLSAKANCHVQIVAKVINDELVITTHDIYDPVVGYGSNILPVFSSAGAVNGWAVSGVADAWKIADNNSDTYSSYYVDPGASAYWYITAPVPLTLLKATVDQYLATYRPTWMVEGKNLISNSWEAITATYTANANRWTGTLNVSSIGQYKEMRFRAYGVPGGQIIWLYSVRLYESPTAKFFRSLNKVKDRSDVEQLWINLGYATVDGSGNITALTHYTDLRNNYPGGMRVEA